MAWKHKADIRWRWGQEGAGVGARGRGEDEGGEAGGGVAPSLKSKDPHLVGGEKSRLNYSLFFKKNIWWFKTPCIWKCNQEKRILQTEVRSVWVWFSQYLPILHLSGRRFLVLLVKATLTPGPRTRKCQLPQMHLAWCNGANCRSIWRCTKMQPMYCG